MKVAAGRIGVSLEEYEHRLAEGLKWCRACRDWHSRGEFFSDASRTDGLSSVCSASRHVKSDRPGQVDRRAKAAEGLAWCRGCRVWLPADGIAQGACRDHRNAAAREWYRRGGGDSRRGRALARKRGLAPIPAWWLEETREEFGGLCAYGCGRPGETIDHVWPFARGGVSAPGNLVPACRSCNSSKRDSMPKAWVLRGVDAMPDPWVQVMELAVFHSTTDWFAGIADDHEYPAVTS
jgi:5-methylcytosine-specific restriction endonuclease McrA